MAGGLVALLDDVAALSRLAAASLDDIGAATGKATAKAAGVVIDDAAVTPQYVRGLAAERELPIVKKIAIGSLRNKILIILPIALLLSQFLPGLLTPILMLGGAYLSYEAAHKIWGALTGHGAHAAADEGPRDEKTVVAGAVRTDLILSAEIMVIALDTVASEGFWNRLIILLVVAVVITVVVYGAVGLIVKMDDIGLRLAENSSGFTEKFGRGLVTAMPKVMSVLSVVGTAAMLWVGGHILLVGIDELGFHPIYELVHHAEDAVHGVAGIGGVLAWIVNTICSAILGFIVGSLIVAIMSGVGKLRGKKDVAASH
jgi:predicted DNA repair protein MutK